MITTKLKEQLSADDHQAALTYVDIDHILENPQNVLIYSENHEVDDEQLYQEIQADGSIKQPLLVKVHPLKPNHYVIIAGHRRYKAACRAGFKTLPCMIEAPKSEKDALKLDISLVTTNIKRRHTSPGERAQEIQYLHNKCRELKSLDPAYHGKTVRQMISDLYGISERAIADYIDINLNLPDEEKERFYRGELSLVEAKNICKAQRSDDGDIEITEDTESSTPYTPDDEETGELGEPETPKQAHTSSSINGANDLHKIQKRLEDYINIFRANPDCITDAIREQIKTLFDLI